MDFFDVKKQRAHRIRLMVGYVLISVVILLATTILMYLAYGFGLDKGKVIQNGLVFFSSHPSNASIYLDGKLKDTTNTRLTLPAGKYTVQMQRDGYRTWQRAVTVEGGQVQHFDYPFLIPSSLTTANAQTYAAAPTLATQSPDRRWLVVQQPGSLVKFDLYDTKNTKQTQATTISLPANLLTATTGTQSLKVVEWSTDNRHVLLQHTYGKTHEYILLDRQTPADSVNLNKKLGMNPSKLTLQNKAYDRYFVYDAAAKTLGTAKLGDTTVTPMLQHVLAYETYGSNIVLYVTDSGKNKPAGSNEVMLYQNNTSYPIRDVPVAAASTYLLNLTQYSGSWYVVAGASSEDRVYVYKNPVPALQKQPYTPLVPVNVLKVNSPNYVAFSANAEFVTVESGSHFAVYDAEYDKSYTYTMPMALDKPQVHAAWMDGDRLDYVSGGKVMIFDYDGTNQQTLMPENAAYVPYFDSSYKYVYSLAPSVPVSKTSAITLTKTALLTPADQ